MQFKVGRYQAETVRLGGHIEGCVSAHAGNQNLPYRLVFQKMSIYSQLWQLHVD